MSKPIIGVWLGDRYTDGAAALSILVSYWLVYGALIVTPGFLVGRGRGAHGGPHARLRGRAQPRARADPHAEAGRGGARGRHRRGVRRRASRCCCAPGCARRARRSRSCSRRAMAPAYVLGALLGRRPGRDPVRARARHARAGRRGRDPRRARLLGRVLRARARPGRARAGAQPAASAERSSCRQLASSGAAGRAPRPCSSSSGQRSPPPDRRSGSPTRARGRSRPSTIDHVRDVREHAEAVREPVGAVELVVVLVAQLEPLPAAERRRPGPDVHEHVEDAAARAPHQLRHARAGSASRAARRGREREWLSWTNVSVTPSSASTFARAVSTKKPRSSPCTVGLEEDRALRGWSRGGASRGG